MKQYLHIGFSGPFANNLNTLDNEILIHAEDWLRYAPGCCIVWTDKTPNEWVAIIKSHLTPSDSVLVVKVDISVNQGWTKQWIWDWINRNRI